LDQVKKTKLAEGFNAFLKAQHIAQGSTNTATPEMANLKREAPMAPKKTGQSTHLIPRTINADV